MSEEENNKFEGFTFPHVMYVSWPIGASSLMNDIQLDKTKLYFKYIGEKSPHLNIGEVYEFRYVAYSPHPETKRRKVLVTSVELSEEEREYKNQKKTIRLEEFPKFSWKKQLKKMKKYNESKETRWTKYKILVPTEEDKLELELAFEHLHYTDCDTDYIAVNQLIHEYLTPYVTGDERTRNNIIVDKKLYEKLNK